MSGAARFSSATSRIGRAHRPGQHQNRAEHTRDHADPLWADLASANERLVDATHPLLAAWGKTDPDDGPEAA